MTDASCYLLSQLDDAPRRAILDDAFGSRGLRLSVARTSIGASDYSLNAYTYDDTPEPDPGLTHFSIDHDRKYILPVLRDARAVNPDLFCFSSPWTPPAWMKDNKSLLGGTMRDRYYRAYADYFCRFLKSYSQADWIYGAAGSFRWISSFPVVPPPAHHSRWFAAFDRPLGTGISAGKSLTRKDVLMKFRMPNYFSSPSGPSSSPMWGLPDRSRPSG